MRSHTPFISISVFALKTSVVQVVAARGSASSREARYLLAFAFKLSEYLSRDEKEELHRGAICDGQATCGKRVRGRVQCNLQHPCLELRRRGDPRSPSRRSDALIGSCRASHARQATREKRVREPIHYCNMCNMCLALHARTSGGRGDPRSPSHSADALIPSCRASYTRQGTREKRVRETSHYCNMPCVACSNEPRRGDPRSPSHSSGALIGSRRASCARQATRVNRVRETIQYCNMRALRCRPGALALRWHRDPARACQ